MDEKDIMATLSSWASEIGKEELENVYTNMLNMENINNDDTYLK